MYKYVFTSLLFFISLGGELGELEPTQLRVPTSFQVAV